MPVELIIFDCDGVLIDSEIIAARIHAEALTRIGYPVTAEQVIERFTGKHGPDIRKLIIADWGRDLPADYFAETDRLMDIAFASDLKAMDGLPEILPQLTVRFCVASNTRLERLHAALRHVDLEATFAPDIFSASMVARGKPAPDLFLHAAEVIGIQPASCLVVEDSVSGVKAARAAGMRVFGFIGGRHCRPDLGASLLAEGAELLFDRMGDLPDLLTR